MKAAVFRAKADGERTARALAALGHEALLAPVTTIRPTGAVVPSGAFDAVIFTSAHGVEALHPKVIARFGSLPCFCVGPRTAFLADRVGFARVHTARADAERLCGLVAGTVPRPSRVLLVAGRDRKPVVETRLGSLGHSVAVVEAYEAHEVSAWAPAVVQAIGGGDTDIALHYSRRSSALALGLATKAGIADALLALRHHCLSADAAAPLLTAGATRITLAASLDEAGLLATLNCAPA